MLSPTATRGSAAHMPGDDDGRRPRAHPHLGADAGRGGPAARARRPGHGHRLHAGLAPSLAGGGALPHRPRRPGQLRGPHLRLLPAARARLQRDLHRGDPHQGRGRAGPAPLEHRRTAAHPRPAGGAVVARRRALRPSRLHRAGRRVRPPLRRLRPFPRPWPVAPGGHVRRGLRRPRRPRRQLDAADAMARAAGGSASTIRCSSGSSSTCAPSASTWPAPAARCASRERCSSWAGSCRACACGWWSHCTRPTGTPGARRVRAGKRTIDIEIRPVEVEYSGAVRGAGSVVRAELEAQRADAHTHVNVTRQADHLLATADWNGASVIRRASQLEASMRCPTWPSRSTAPGTTASSPRPSRRPWRSSGTRADDAHLGGGVRGS